MSTARFQTRISDVDISTTNLAACVYQCGKCEQFLPACSHFDSKRPENFVRIASFPSATFGPLFAFHYPLFFLRKAIIWNKIVTLRHSRCFENGNDDFGVEAFWTIHCAHWSSGFMVLNASISRVLGQRPMFYRGWGAYVSPYYSAINVQCSYEKTK